MGTENYSLKNNRKSRAFFIGATVLLAAAVLLPAGLFRHTPTICLWTLVGLGPCPGCGMTRAVWYLLHGQFKTAIAFNWMVVMVAPILAWIYLKLGYQAITGREARLKFLEKKIF